MQQSTIAPWKLLKPFARLFESYGKQLENAGNNLIRNEFKAFLPRKFGYVLHEADTQVALNNEPLTKLGVIQPRLTESDVLLKELIPIKFNDHLVDKLFVAHNSIIGSGVSVSPFSTIWYGTQIGNNVTVDENTHILDNSTISGNCKIGKNVVIMPGVFVGENVTIEDDCLVEAGMRIEDNSVIAKNTQISPIVQFLSKEKNISTQNLSEVKSRREALIDVIREAGFGEHKREMERTISEITEVRFDLALKMCELEDVLKPGSWQEQQHAREIEASRDKYALYKEDKSVFLTDARVEKPRAEA